MTENAEKNKSEKMVKMEELRKQLADLEVETEISTPSSKSKKQIIHDETVQSQTVDKQVEEGSETSVSDDEEIEVKPKRERTEKQKQAFLKAQETRLKKAEERKKERSLKDQEEKEELEKKLIEKAIKVKKKQIKKMQVIEQLSDDDTPIQKPVSEPSKRQIITPSKQSIVEKPKLRFI